MRGILALVVVLAWGCNVNNQQSQTRNDQNKHDPCPPEWHATGKEIKQVNIGDSTEQIFLNDTLWFEIIGPSAYATNQHKAWIKNYRPNGMLESEGLAVYVDHPIADYEQHGKWNLKGRGGVLGVHLSKVKKVKLSLSDARVLGVKFYAYRIEYMNEPGELAEIQFWTSGIGSEIDSFEKDVKAINPYVKVEHWAVS